MTYTHAQCRKEIYNHMRKLKVYIITTGRSDYGLLYPLITELSNNNNFNIHVIVTGSHLSQFHGYSVNQVKKDFINVEIIDLCLKNDKEHDICLAISTGLKSFSNLYYTKKPDLIVVLGDRYELLAACIPATIHKIPIAHIHGGEVTSGQIDDSIRHSITKISHFHFASIQQYANRIIQLGENPKYVFVVGAIGIDNIRNIDLMTSEELATFSGVNFNKKIALMTYHPVTLDEYSMAKNQIEKIMNAVLDTNLIILTTMPNTDPAGNLIQTTIMDYKNRYPNKIVCINNLGQVAYLSAMKYATLMIGNSSSGIIESASFRLPVVNIGDRQNGRVKTENVIDCECETKDILEAIKKATSKKFLKSISDISNPYDQGNTSKKIAKIIENVDIINKNRLIKKEFYDLPFLNKLNI